MKPLWAQVIEGGKYHAFKPGEKIVHFPVCGVANWVGPLWLNHSYFIGNHKKMVRIADRCKNCVATLRREKEEENDGGER